jgi:hypothetical protein
VGCLLTRNNSLIGVQMIVYISAGYSAWKLKSILTGSKPNLNWWLFIRGVCSA